MLQQPKESASFSQADADVIINVLENQPLQNLRAAASIELLIRRFRAFVACGLVPAAPAADKQEK